MEHMMMGFSLLFTFESLLMMVIGCVMGYLLGVMPGISATIALALFIPFTFNMDVIPAIVLLICVYSAQNFGGGITSILLNTPGSPSAAAAVLDGYPLAKKGQAKKALGMQIWASGVGEASSAILLIVFSLSLATFALRFGPPEFFLLALMGLSVVAGLAADNMVKGLIMAVIGMFLTTIGMDPIGGAFRYVASFYFLEGIPFIPALIGLFAISEVFVMITEKAEGKQLVEISGEGLTFEEFKSCKGPLTMGAGVGFLLGLVPAAGPNIASWIAYSEAKRMSKNPENFGKGELAGIAAPETANNAAATGSLVPTLALGIPGSPPAAVLLGALSLHGIAAGPLLFERNPEIPFTVFAVSLVIVPVLMAIGLFGARYFSLVSKAPKTVIAPLILATCTVGSFAIGGTMFGVWVAYIFGVIGYILKRFNFPAPPLVLALVLGRLAESNFRRSMLMSRGSLTIFFERPITVVIMILTVFMFAYPFIQSYIKKKKAAAGK